MVKLGLISPKVGQTSGEIAMRIYSTGIKSEENTVKEFVSATQAGSQKVRLSK